MPERFFRIWHQMNHSPAARGRLQYLLEFFATWYATREERDAIWDELLTDLDEGLAIGDQDRVTNVTSYMSYVAAAADGSEKYAREFEPLKILAARNGPDSVVDRLTTLDREYGRDADYWVHKGCFLAEAALDDAAALDAFTTATRIAPEHLAATFNRARALDRLGRKTKAVAVYRQAVALLANEASVTHRDDIRLTLLDTLRNSESQRATWFAGRLLGRLGGHEVTSSIVEVLGVAENPWRRRHCINALGMLGDVEAAKAVLRYLNDDACDVRGATATALGKLGSAQAVGPLIDCLRDQDGVVRGSAATALGKLGSAEAVGPLIRLLKDIDPATRGSAATALGKLGSAQAVGPLIDCLRDAVDNVRGSSATALGRIGNPQAVDALIVCLDDQASAVCASAATAITRIAEKTVTEHLGRVLPVIVAKLPARHMRRLRPVVPSLLASAFRSRDLNVVREAIQAVESRWQDGAAIYAPHAVALKFLKSGRSPEIIERQQPEMREAVEMLVRAFNGGETPGGDWNG
jgi:HEAT repeat protein